MSKKPARASAATPEDDEATSLETAATETLGLRWHDRPTLYVETATAATDTDLPFWLVLFLSGTIALFGLALDATAVVIGAMLIAPLLAPLLGLSLSLTVGDGRLAVQTGVTVALGAIGVVLISALLTLALPFQEVTSEILARTRPTTLDLAIAVASGLAGAVVTVSREKRLSASIPGVAIAVALIPPLGVAGFGIGTGWQWDLIYGSMLLFGANFGGIVLSGMAAFLVVGMHRPDVVEAARKWHRRGEQQGLCRILAKNPTLARLGVFSSPLPRAAMVLGFVALVAVPLSSSLTQVAREIRVQQAVGEAEESIRRTGPVVLGRSVQMGVEQTAVRFRLATDSWLSETDRRRIESTASVAAGEPVTVDLDQVLVSDRERDALQPDPATAQLLSRAPSGSAPSSPPALLRALDERVDGALSSISLPDNVAVAGAEISLGSGGRRVRVAYAAERRLAASSEIMLARQAARALGVPQETASTTAFTPLHIDSLNPRALAERMAPFPRLHVVVEGDSAVARAGMDALIEAGLPAARVRADAGSGGGAGRLRFSVDEERQNF